MSTLITKPNIKSTVIPYYDNQHADPNLWDCSFSSISLFRTEKSLDKDAKNLATSNKNVLKPSNIKKSYIGFQN